MNPKKNKSKKMFGKKLVGISVLIIVIVLVFQTVVNYGVEITSYLLFPVQKKIYVLGNYLKDTSDAVTKYKKILKEDKILREKNIQYERAMEINRELLNENIKLRRILNIKERDNLDIKVAKINFRKHINLYEKFYIDLGSNDGIKKNMIVLSEDNKLIGRVSRVYGNYSIVKMITAENSNISALSSITNMLGIIRGSNEDDGTLYFEPNTFKNTLQIGEKLYTSGVSDIYPKGLYIGYISEIDDAKGDVFRSIKVRNDVDVLNLTDVMILMPRKKGEEK